MPVIVGEAVIGDWSPRTPTGTWPSPHGWSCTARPPLPGGFSTWQAGREVPARSRSELLAELLISESAVNDDLLDRARQLNVALSGWHVAVRIEADDLDGPGLDGSGPGEQPATRYAATSSWRQPGRSPCRPPRRPVAPGTCPGWRAPSC